MNAVPSVVVSKKVVKSISSGRKLFKFLRFVDEVKHIADLLSEKGNNHGLLVRSLSLFARICGFFYYLLDNVVWFSNMGMIR